MAIDRVALKSEEARNTDVQAYTNTRTKRVPSFCAEYAAGDFLSASRDELRHAGSIFYSFVSLSDLSESLSLGFSVFFHDEGSELVLVLVDEVVDLEYDSSARLDGKFAPLEESGLRGSYGRVYVGFAGDSYFGLCSAHQRFSNRHILPSLGRYERVIDPVVNLGEGGHCFVRC